MRRAAATKASAGLRAAARSGGLVRRSCRAAAIGTTGAALYCSTAPIVVALQQQDQRAVLPASPASRGSVIGVRGNPGCEVSGRSRSVLGQLLFALRCAIRACELALLSLPLLLTAPLLFAGTWRPRWYRLLVWSVHSAGPTFIKLGQWGGTRPDIFPPQLCDALGVLHDDVPSHSVRCGRNHSRLK